MQAPEFISRLERLKKHQNWSWAEAAKAIGLSRSMVHFIKAGRYGVSESAVQQLRRSEREAGINPRAKAIVEAITRQVQQSKAQLSKEEVASGKKVVEVSFVAGEPPAGLRTTVELTRPDVRQSARLVADILTDESVHGVLLACLPKELANETFFNALTPFSYNALCDAAMTLVFGLDWQERLPPPDSSEPQRRL